MTNPAHYNCDFSTYRCEMGFDDKWDFDDGMSTFIMVAIAMVGVFITFTACMCLCAYLRQKDRRAIYTTPVVVTAQSYQPATNQGMYPVSVHTTSANNHQTAIPMPQPQIQIPIQNQTPYPMMPQPAVLPRPAQPAVPLRPAHPANVTSQNVDQDPPTYKQATGRAVMGTQQQNNSSYGS